MNIRSITEWKLIQNIRNKLVKNINIRCETVELIDTISTEWAVP
jgi:hypothetical protein